MNKKIEKPYVLHVAEIIYFEILNIKKKENISNIDAFERFIGSKTYKEISSGKFHNNWLKNLKKNNFIDETTKKKNSTGNYKTSRNSKGINGKTIN